LIPPPNRVAIAGFQLFKESLIEWKPNGDLELRELRRRASPNYRNIDLSNFTILLGFVITGYTKDKNDSVDLEGNIRPIKTETAGATHTTDSSISDVHFIFAGDGRFEFKNVNDWRHLLVPTLIGSDKVLAAFGISETTGIPVTGILCAAPKVVKEWDGFLQIIVSDHLTSQTVRREETLLLDKEQMIEGSQFHFCPRF
jgi:hypothetical protein